MTIYRLTKATYQDTTFSGLGALRSAGRWNEAGSGLVYASDTPAGALLEIIVRTEATALRGHAYVLFTVRLEPARSSPGVPFIFNPRLRWARTIAPSR